MSDSTATTNEYYGKNALGQVRCKLCDTLHRDDANFIIHIGGKKHTTNIRIIELRLAQQREENETRLALSRQEAHLAHQQQLSQLTNGGLLPLAPLNTAAAAAAASAKEKAKKMQPQSLVATVGLPDVKVQVEEIGTNQMHSRITFTLHFPFANTTGTDTTPPSRPLHRWKNTYEQSMEPRDPSKQYLVFACEPYESVAYAFPTNVHVATPENTDAKDIQRYFCRWNPLDKTYLLMFTRYNKEDSSLLRSVDKRREQAHEFTNEQSEVRSRVSSLTASTAAAAMKEKQTLGNNNGNNQIPHPPPTPPSATHHKSIQLTKYVLNDKFEDRQPSKKNQFTVTNTSTAPQYGRRQQQQQNDQNQHHKTSTASVCSQSSARRSCSSASKPQQDENTKNDQNSDVNRKAVEMNAGGRTGTAETANTAATSSTLSKENLENWMKSVPSSLPPIPSGSARGSLLAAAGGTKTAGAKDLLPSSSSSASQSAFSTTTLSHHAASSALVSGVSSVNRRLQAIEERIEGEKELRNDLRKALQEVRSIVDKQKKLETNMNKEFSNQSQVSGGSRRKIFM